MNILFFVESGLGNSALLVDQAIAIYEQHKNLFVIMSNVNQESGLQDKLKDLKIPSLVLDGLYEHKSFFLCVKLLRDVINHNRIDIVHVQTNWELALISYVKYILKCNIKIIYTVHAYRHNYRIRSYLMLILLNIVLRFFTDAVICMCSTLIHKFPFIKKKIILIPLGIDNRYFIDKFSIENNNLRLIFPAQFRHGKNQDLIIKAFAKYISITNDKKSKLVLPGEGEKREDMILLTKALHCENQVDMPGFCSKEEILLLYRNSNLAIVASNNETYGQCIVEPYVLGRGVITTNVGIAPDIIKSGINGFFFKHENELVDILVKLYENKELIKCMGYYNFCRRDNFRWDVIVKDYLTKISLVK